MDETSVTFTYPLVTVRLTLKTYTDVYLYTKKLSKNVLDDVMRLFQRKPNSENSFA